MKDRPGPVADLRGEAADGCGGPGDLGAHTAAYRALLALYPRAYRREVGEDVVAAFRDLCRARARSGGRWAVARLWLRTLPRMVWGGLAERVAAVREGGADPGERRPPYGWAVLAGGLVLALYAATLAPTTAFWDASEYIATAHLLGVPHPPGTPLFVVLARSWELLLAPLGLSVAVRVNLFSAFASAAAHGLWFLVVHHVLRSFGTGRAFRLVGAGVAVLTSATAFTVWNQSNVNEKVYTVSLLVIALLTWLALRWQQGRGRTGNDRLLVLMAFILALGVGNHLMSFLAAPALALFVLLVKPEVLARWRLYPAAVGAVLLGVSIHLFLPVRAAHDPVINEGAPECASMLEAVTSITTWGRGGCQALSDVLTRRQYTLEGEPGPGLQGPRQAPPVAQYTNYLQYFDWQWARGVQGDRVLFADLRIPFTMLFTGLGVWGALAHARRSRTSFVYMLALFSTLSVALVWYMNFEYGYSIPDPFGDPDLHEVRERDYFFVVSFSLWGLWAGMGLAALWRWLAHTVTGSLLRASPVLLVALLPLALNASWADRSYDWAARDWAYNLLQSVEPYGVLFTYGDNDTFPLWYLQEVEGIRRDVTVVVTTYLTAPWYVKQLRDLTSPCPDGVSAGDDPTRIICQRAYEAHGRAAYTHRPDRVEPGRVALALPGPLERPGGSILELDDATIDRVATSYVPMDEPRVANVGPIRPVIPGGQYLYPWQQYALAIVDTAFADGRPVYWSSSGNQAGSLGLDRYLVRQGLAYKVSDRLPEPEPPEGVVRLPEAYAPATTTGRYVDVERTDTLVSDVFVHRSGLPRWDHWPDPTTSGVPYYYAWAYEALAVAAWVRGDGDEALRYRRQADDWARLGQ